MDSHNLKRISATVETMNGRPGLYIDGRLETPMFYALTDVPGGRWSWEEIPRHNIEAFHRAGFRLFQLDIFLEQLWPRPGVFDIGLLKRQFAGVLDIATNAAIMVRFHLNPPAWWIESHTDELVAYDQVGCEPESAVGLTRILEADPRNACRISLASSIWKCEVTAAFTDILSRFVAEPESAALAAIQVACGVYGEWHYWGFMKWEPDVSRAMTTHFRSWLSAKYSNDGNLQKSWNDEDVALATAVVPGIEQRDQTFGVFRDPAAHRSVIDYYMCQHELVSDLIIHFCRTAAASWPGQIIAGAFYGYYFSVFNRQAAGGHLELSRVLESDDVDFLCGPQVYYPDDQAPGHPYRSRGLLHSVALHGKLWLDEYDQEPALTYPFLGGMTDNRQNYRKKVDANRACIRRGTLFALQKGMGLWFYDFGPSGMHINRAGEYNGQLGTAGYWDNPEYMADITAIKRIADDRSNREYSSSADVLLVYDPRSHYYMSSTIENADPVTPKSIDWLTLGLYYSGVVFDAIAAPDLELVDLAQYKLIILANTYLIDEAVADRLWERARRAGSELLWIHAPGILADDFLQPDRVGRIVRLDLEKIVIEDPPSFCFSPTVDTGAARPAEARNDEITESLDGPCSPLFEVVDPHAEPRGWYIGTSSTRVAAARSVCVATYSRNDVGAWYTGLPPTSPAIFRDICREAGVHTYTGSGDIAYAGAGLLTIHTRHGGLRRVHLKNGSFVDIRFSDGPGTVVLDEATGEILLPAVD